MRVFELIYPGTWLQGLSQDVGHEVQSVLYVMESHLADAAIGLAMFEDARGRRFFRPDWSDANGQVRRLVEGGMEVEQHRQRQAEDKPPMTPEERWKAGERARFEAERLLARAEWDSGETPEGYLRRLPFIYAHTVLFALDGLSKALGVLARMPDLPPGVAAASEAFATVLPSVAQLRNSAHHVEDRARAKGPYEKTIALKPIANNMLKSPGGALVLSALNNNRLGYTLANGHYDEVEISEASVDAAREAVQALLDALDWRGSRRLVPGR